MNNKTKPTMCAVIAWCGLLAFGNMSNVQAQSYGLQRFITNQDVANDDHEIYLTLRVESGIFELAAKKARALSSLSSSIGAAEMTQELLDLKAETDQKALAAAPANKDHAGKKDATGKFIPGGEEDWKELVKRIDKHIARFTKLATSDPNHFDPANPRDVARRYEETAKGLKRLADAYEKVGTTGRPLTSGGSQRTTTQYHGLRGILFNWQLNRFKARAGR